MSLVNLSYHHNAAVAFDCWLNTMRGGIPGVTISSDAARARDRGETWGKVLCAVLDFIQTNHSDGALINDMARADAVRTYLENNPGAKAKEVLAAVPIPSIPPAEIVSAIKERLPEPTLSFNSDQELASSYSWAWRKYENCRTNIGLPDDDNSRH